MAPEYVFVAFSSEAIRLLIRKQGLDSLERIIVLTDKKVNDIHNIVRKPGNKNANGISNTG